MHTHTGRVGQKILFVSLLLVQREELNVVETCQIMKEKGMNKNKITSVVKRDKRVGDEIALKMEPSRPTNDNICSLTRVLPYSHYSFPKCQCFNEWHKWS